MSMRLILGIGLGLLHLVATFGVGVAAIGSALGNPSSFDVGRVFDVFSFPVGWLYNHAPGEHNTPLFIVALILNSFGWGYGIALVVCALYPTGEQRD